MRFAQGSVRLLAQVAASMVSFRHQAKGVVLVADALRPFLFGAAVAQAAGQGTLFSFLHQRKESPNRNNGDTSTPVSSSGVVAPLVPRETTTSSSSHELSAADVGILTSAHMRRSSSSDVEDQGKEDITRKMARPRTIIDPLLYSVPEPSEYAADAGILSSHGQEDDGNSKDSTVMSSSSTTPVFPSSATRMISNVGYVDCVDGYTKKRTPCSEACGGKCCYSGSQDPDYPHVPACQGFTGRVYKDGSCSGAGACSLGVNIARVENSCRGNWTCSFANFAQGVVNSCIGYRACSGLQSSGVVQDSCVGTYACNENYIYSAFIDGYVVNSCRGEFACQDIGSCFQMTNKGKIRNVGNSCNGERACSALGMYGSFYGNVESSCNGYIACVGLGYRGIVVGDIQNSCNNDTACVQLAYRGAVGNLVNSCNDAAACFGAGSMYCVGYINSSIPDLSGCKIQGRVSKQAGCCTEFVGGGITTDMENCCNEKKACNYTTENNLPEQCWVTNNEVSVV